MVLLASVLREGIGNITAFTLLKRLVFRLSQWELQRDVQVNYSKH